MNSIYNGIFLAFLWYLYFWMSAHPRIKMKSPVENFLIQICGLIFPLDEKVFIFVSHVQNTLRVRKKLLLLYENRYTEILTENQDKKVQLLTFSNFRKIWLVTRK